MGRLDSIFLAMAFENEDNYDIPLLMFNNWAMMAKEAIAHGVDVVGNSYTPPNYQLIIGDRLYDKINSTEKEFIKSYTNPGINIITVPDSDIFSMIYLDHESILVVGKEEFIMVGDKKLFPETLINYSRFNMVVPSGEYCVELDYVYDHCLLGKLPNHNTKSYVMGAKEEPFPEIANPQFVFDGEAIFSANKDSGEYKIDFGETVSVVRMIDKTL